MDAEVAESTATAQESEQNKRIRLGKIGTVIRLAAMTFSVQIAVIFSVGNKVKERWS